MSPLFSEVPLASGMINTFWFAFFSGFVPDAVFKNLTFASTSDEIINWVVTVITSFDSWAVTDACFLVAINTITFFSNHSGMECFCFFLAWSAVDNVHIWAVFVYAISSPAAIVEGIASSESTSALGKRFLFSNAISTNSEVWYSESHYRGLSSNWVASAFLWSTLPYISKVVDDIINVITSTFVGTDNWITPDEVLAVAFSSHTVNWFFFVTTGIFWSFTWFAFALLFITWASLVSVSSQKVLNIYLPLFWVANSWEGIWARTAFTDSGWATTSSRIPVTKSSSSAIFDKLWAWPFVANKLDGWAWNTSNLNQRAFKGLAFIFACPFISKTVFSLSNTGLHQTAASFSVATFTDTPRKALAISFVKVASVVTASFSANWSRVEAFSVTEISFLYSSLSVAFVSKTFVSFFEPDITGFFGDTVVVAGDGVVNFTAFAVSWVSALVSWALASVSSSWDGSETFAVCWWDVGAGKKRSVEDAFVFVMTTTFESVDTMTLFKLVFVAWEAIWSVFSWWASEDTAFVGGSVGASFELAVVSALVKWTARRGSSFDLNEFVASVTAVIFFVFLADWFQPVVP